MTFWSENCLLGGRRATAQGEKKGFTTTSFLKEVLYERRFRNLSTYYQVWAETNSSLSGSLDYLRQAHQGVSVIPRTWP